uniref:EF-hand domain-containing protein n=1 Tax=Timspurckia oligopyrenoides TaxID=708627 RepID=A0A7S0ZIS2_9RHOD|mmetsp:Transcript_6946/g.12445  ORF Transcript_6946/g.12445 Transcript_6946/m.12445 type:complete len:610 (+) Transcript_6946:125-1954(+)
MGMFIDPSSLPGGKVWKEVCLSIGGSSGIDFGCDSSPLSGFIQVLGLLLVYGYVLYTASNMISDGSELLLLVPSLRNIVGSVVLPILGAVPDSAIILFSAMGENAQEEVSVGVGALAGSTIMLLTVPWFLSVVGGRVSILPNGQTNYKRVPGDPGWTKLFAQDRLSLTRAGVEALPSVSHAGFLMLLTSLSYFIIQLPAFASGNYTADNTSHKDLMRAAKMEHWYAAVGAVVCGSMFVWYLYEQIRDSQSGAVDLDERLGRVQVDAIESGMISLSGAFYKDLADLVESTPSASAAEGTALLAHQKSVSENKAFRESPAGRLRNVLKTFFKHYDRDHNGYIDGIELGLLMNDLGENLSKSQLNALYSQIDGNMSGSIDFDEFAAAIPDFIRSKTDQIRSIADGKASTIESRSSGLESLKSIQKVQSEAEDDNEEEEDVPEELQDSDPARQLRKIMQRSFMLMTLGTVLVLIFSDPMVDVLGDVGSRLGVSPFYISFVCAPLASNASELLASYKYSLKKTKKTITISFSALFGAACMNNSLGLMIFMIIIFAKGLAWKFSAETLSILLVESVMFFVSRRRVHTVAFGGLVLMLFPLSLLTVAFLENVIGLD